MFPKSVVRFSVYSADHDTTPFWGACRFDHLDIFGKRCKPRTNHAENHTKNQAVPTTA